LTETKAFFAANNVNFYANAVRITQRGSGFDTAPDADKWLAAFPMWDWVGGRTSVLSAVGLLPLSLQGLDAQALLAGAHDCDSLTRREAAQNPALQLALFWYQASGGQGGTSMAVLPYKDRLELFAKYLQQLVMESLGKELDLDGKTVHQGLAVFGNKGSSDQHSYVQQLVAGPENVFVVFIEVLRDRAGASPIVREGSTSGDYLQAFMLGTTKALAAHGKQSMIITVPEVSAYYIGMLIALFERAVGFYASFVHINAYHQPAVEFGKKACGEVITLKNAAQAFLTERPGEAYTAAELAGKLGAADGSQLWHILRHLAANDEKITAVADESGELKFSATK
jgi:glucose-6-phosphate isomerase